MHPENAVGSEIKWKKQSAPMPVLGNVSNPSTFAPPRIDIVKRLVLQQYFPRCRIARARKDFYQLSLPVTFDTGDSQRLASTHFERKAVENRFAFRALKRELPHAQHPLLRLILVLLFAEHD